MVGGDGERETGNSRSLNSRGRIRVGGGGSVESECGGFEREFRATVGSWRE